MVSSFVDVWIPCFVLCRRWWCASKEIMTIMLPPGVPAINPRIYQGPPLFSTVMSFMMAMINCRRLLLLLFSAWMTRRRALSFIQLAKFIPRVNINICAHKQQRKSPYTPPWVWVWSTALAKAQIKHIVSIVGGGRVGDEFELILASTVTQGFL